MKQFEFYGDIDDVDFRIIVTKTDDNRVLITESHCRRNSIAGWSDDVTVTSDKSYWDTVVDQIDSFGGWKEIRRSLNDRKFSEWR